MTRRFILWIKAMLVVVILVGCQNNDEAVFKGGSNEKRPEAILLSNNALTEGSRSTIGTFKFALQITSISQVAVCKGEVDAKIMSDFTFEVPSGEVRCAGLRIDLAKMVGQMGGSQAIGKIGSLGAKDGVVYVGEIANAKFEPARPMLLGPIIRNVDRYEGMDKSSDHKMTFQDASGQKVTKDGGFRLKVLNVRESLSMGDNTFDQVIRWTLNRNGFDGVSPLNGLVFDEMEWCYNVSPIMIPYMKIKANIKDFVKLDDPGLADVIGKSVTVELAVKDYKL